MVVTASFFRKRLLASAPLLPFVAVGLAGCAPVTERLDLVNVQHLDRQFAAKPLWHLLGIEELLVH